MQKRTRILRSRALRAGRDLELLVARIEAELSAAGVAIKSPDHLPDRIAGGTREVDVSLRSKVGSADVLVIVECRDRRRREDVTWIEQVHSKRQAVGASRAIAVSSRAFSSKARIAAKNYGIEVRMLSQISDSDIRRWAGVLQVSLRDINYSDCRMSVVIFGTETIAAAAWNWIESLVRKDVFDCHFISVQNDEQLWSPLDFVRRQIQSGVPLRKGSQLTVTIPPKTAINIGPEPALHAIVGDDFPIDGSVTEKRFMLEFDDNDAFVRWEELAWRIKQVIFDFNVQCVAETAIDSQTYRYDSPEGVVAEIAQRTAILASGDQLIMNEHRRAPSSGSTPETAGPKSPPE